jgi:heme exporter protein D
MAGTVMKRKWLAVGISTISVIILILTSLTNVVGYQSVQTSQQNLIKERINQRELLFQTICDIANNKEIQRMILKSQMSRGIFPTSELPVVTKNQIRQMYFLGLILSKFISKSRIHSMVQQYQLQNPNIQEGINGVIEKDTIINSEISQLKNSECDCENEKITRWSFPVLCILILPLFAISLGMVIMGISEIPIDIMMIIGFILNCFWYQEVVP